MDFVYQLLVMMVVGTRGRSRQRVADGDGADGFRQIHVECVDQVEGLGLSGLQGLDPMAEAGQFAEVGIGCERGHVRNGLEGYVTLVVVSDLERNRALGAEAQR